MTIDSLERRRAIAVLGALGLAPLAGLAQGAWPNRPVKVVVPFPAGGALDVTARALTEPLQQRLGQSFVIDNKPGAGARLGTELAVRSPADGYTLLVATPSSTSVAPALVPGLGYDPFTDLVPVARVAEIINIILVPATRPINNVPALIAWAKQQRRPIDFGTSGVGSADHLGAETFRLQTGLNMQHVPYKGGGLAMADLATERLDMCFATYAAASPLIQSGKVRPIAVTTRTRSQLLPDLPAVSEAVPNFGVSNWAGLFLPKGTPTAIRDRLFKEVSEIVEMPTVKSIMNKGGLEVAMSKSPDEFAALLREESRSWARTIKEANIRAE